jgi:multicomponent Na+:H+ antiporter subunit C
VEIILALITGSLFAGGVFLLLQRSIFKMVLGLVLFSQGASLVVFTASDLTRGYPPLVATGETTPKKPYADPLPQALILTAIVINFGVLSFALVLAHRYQQSAGTGDPDELING